MENVSAPIIILFLLTVVATVWIFFKAARFSRPVILLVSGYTLAQSLLGISGFYTSSTGFPPRFLLLIAPAILCIIVLFSLPRGRKFIDSFNIEYLTLLHVIRIPIEITLYYLLLAKLVPTSMTFEGSNFDIISGISAPLVYYFVFVARKVSERVLLVWNFICLALLLNVVITALLSAKTPFQKFAFDQPNIGVTYFPFVLLPAVVVPIVLLSHLVSIWKIMVGKFSLHSSAIVA